MLKDCSEIVEMTEPYIAGFLAFREVQHLFKRLKDLEHHYPHLKPQVSVCVCVCVVCVCMCVCVCMQS